MKAYWFQVGAGFYSLPSGVAALVPNQGETTSWQALRRATDIAVTTGLAALSLGLQRRSSPRWSASLRADQSASGVVSVIRLNRCTTTYTGVHPFWLPV